MRNKLTLGAGLLLVGLLLLLGTVVTRAADFRAFNQNFHDFQFQPDFQESAAQFKGSFYGSFTNEFKQGSFGFDEFSG